MLFISSAFAVFLPIVFGAYWMLHRHTRAQNLVLLIGSFVFYGWWDARFLILLVANGLLDFILAQRIESNVDIRQRKNLLLVSVFANMGTLGFFKYFDFFSKEFASLLSDMGFHANPILLEVILPVGISFYTFQTLSYTIDVYRGLLPASKSPITFLAFVSFFPQLVAGPIERAVNFLPQFQRARSFNVNHATDGMRQMLWGFFKKAVIADGCAPIVDQMFSEPGWYSGSTLAFGAILFAFQIYCDFSGYTDIALGCARLFGFELMRNFAYPYFSRDIAEFWRRWHISLSTWFRDYVYLPLGGSRGNKWNQLRNVMIVFLISGFWHGANWNFLMWGLLNGMLFIPLLIEGKNKRYARRGSLANDVAGLRDMHKVLLTFTMTTITWIFFRSDTISEALRYLRGITTKSLFTIPDNFNIWLIMAIIFLIVTEWIQIRRRHGLDLSGVSALGRWTIYIVIFNFVFFLGRFGNESFIYFQF